MKAEYVFLEIERHKLIVERSKKLIGVLHGEDEETVQSIMKASKAALDKYNTENRTVIDITKTEDGLWRGNVKKLVLGKFTEYFANGRRHNDKSLEFEDACGSTTFPDELKLKYILLHRQVKWPNLNPLQLALKETIHTEILTVFQNQNQQLIATT